LINKSFKQLNAERAARRASFLIRYNLGLCEKKKKINKASSARAGGPSPEEPGFKPSSAIKGTHSKGKILTIQNK